jgi:hypothetical protein
MMALLEERSVDEMAAEETVDAVWSAEVALLFVVEADYCTHVRHCVEDSAVEYNTSSEANPSPQKTFD